MNVPRFTLHQNYDNVDVTHTFETPLLSEVLEQMEHFLRGCGFVFDGQLDIVSEETKDMMEESERLSVELQSMDNLPRCDVCKLKKSVMKEYTCFDKHCPKDKW
jgi:hypothetical protein